MYDNICTNLHNWHQNHDTEQFHQPPKTPPHSAHPPPPTHCPSILALTDLFPTV